MLGKIQRKTRNRPWTCNFQQDFPWLCFKTSIIDYATTATYWKQFVKQTCALEVGGKVDLHHLRDVGSMPLLVIQYLVDRVHCTPRSLSCVHPKCVVVPTVCSSASTPCSKAVIHCCVTKRSPRQRLRWITRELLNKLTRGDLLSQLLFPIRTPTQNESNDWSWLLAGWVVVQKKGGKVTRWRDRAMDPAYNESAPGYSVV